MENLTAKAATLNGWQRIGVVLSGAWALFIFGVVAFSSGATKLGEFLLAVAVPIIVLWVGGYVLSICVRWIAAGFGWKGTTGMLASRVIGGRVEMPGWALVLIVLAAVLVGLLVAPSSALRRALY